MSSGRFDHATLEAAADWFARLQAAPEDQRLQEQWRIWLEEGEAQRHAWSYVERVSQRFAGLQNQGAVAHQALTSARTNKRSRRQLLGQLGGLTGAAVFGWMAWNNNWLDGLSALRAQYRTQIGERRLEVLSDGTRLWLNSNSSVDVHFDVGRRLLRLYAGEVLIETGRDSRPLWVRTKAGLLKPMGTRFSVREDGPLTQLSVFEGAVHATCAKSGRNIVVEASQSMNFDAYELGTLGVALGRREAWSRGLLLAEDMPLAQFVKELGNYRRGHLGVDPTVADLRVIGSFPLSDTDLALTQLEEVLPVRIQQRFDWWVTIVPR